MKLTGLLIVLGIAATSVLARPAEGDPNEGGITGKVDGAETQGMGIAAGGNTGAATGGQRMPGDARKLAVRDLLFPREAKPQEDDGGDEEKRKLAVRDTLLPREETKCDLGDDDEC